MAQTVFTFETNFDGAPVASGDAPTAAALGAQQINPGGSVVYHSGAAMRGSLGLRCTGVMSVFRLQPGGGSGTATSNQMSWLFGFGFNSGTLASGYAGMAAFRHSGGNVAILRWNADDSLILCESDGTVVDTILPAGTSRTTKRWYSFVCNNATGGAWSFRVLNLDGTLMTEKTGTRTWASTAAMGPVQLGVSNTLASSMALDFDHVVIGLGESAHITPPAVVEPPLPTPVLTVTKTDPTAPAATDGQAAATWTGAGTFESCILPGSVTTGAVSTRSSTATNRTFTGLAAGTYTVAVRRTV